MSCSRSARPALAIFGAATRTVVLAWFFAVGVPSHAQEIFSDGFETGDTSAWSAEFGPCRDDGGLTAQQLLAPIDTFVVLMMEGRSFDHVLGSLSLVEGQAVDGLTGAESNPAPGGGTVAVHPFADYTLEVPPMSWDAAHAQWNGGANDGFVTEHAGTGQADVMGYYVRSQLPVTYALADGGVVCDAWFSSLLGPTWPNRFYLHGATSEGVQTNTPIVGFTSIFDALDDAGVTNTNYYGDSAWATSGYFKFAGLALIDEYFDDAAAGTLPNLSLIDPTFAGVGANSDHPGQDLLLGQALISSVFSALANSPQWESSLFVLVYSNHGGFYDHVPPPTTVDTGGFEQLGFRVPAIVAGPFVKPDCVVSDTLEHVSVISTMTTRYGLAPMNARAAATADLSRSIHAPYLSNPQSPPSLLPLQLPRDLLDSLSARGENDRRAAIERWLARGVALGAVRWR